MDGIVTGALGSVLSKLAEFLKDEYYLQTGVREKITSLSLELESMHEALRKVSGVPRNELDEQVKLWARDVRGLSYTVEDILDDFLVRVVAGRKRKDPDMKWYQQAANKILEVFSEAKARREISCMIRKINEKAKEVAKRRERYSIDSIVAKAATKNAVDPRLTLMYREVTQLVAIDKSRGELMTMLQGDNNMVKMVSIVGVGGLGKTTLAKASYDEVKSSYDCSAFVSVGQKPDFSKFFKDILFNLDKTEHKNIHNTGRGLDLLIRELQEFLKNKRYFIVVDDIWEPQSWETIKLALLENNCGSRIIITTRIFEVAKQADEVYKLEPLSLDNSKKLFYTRLFGSEDKCPNNRQDELSNTILKKCGGIPLAIITMASFLLGKSRKEWIEVCNSPGFCQDKNDRHMDNTMNILSLSYYDLPYHLKTCLLYLSVFPEDSFIDKALLIRMWISEGFVEKKPGRVSFEEGDEYFHELINRSMIQGVDSEGSGIMDGCRVHDMVLDLIVLMSREEKFASADGTLSESHTRRLAPKNRELDLTQDSDMNLPQVRSFIVWGCAIIRWAMHPRLKLVRVLALDNCTFRERCKSLEHIGNLLHLRYLRIRGLWFEQLPDEIGNLKFLHTLDLENIGYPELPCSIGKLTQLVCLRARGISVPVGVVGKLTSLEELQIGGHKDKNECQRQFVKDLGNLCELRVLEINSSWNRNERMETDLVQSLGNLEKMQHLRVAHSIGCVRMNVWDAAVPSRDLRCLFLPHIRFHKLPSWMSSAHLPSLSHLEISVLDMDQQGLKALGGLPDLRYLQIYIHGSVTNNTETDGCFQKLRSLVLWKSMVQFVTNEDSGASFTICHMNNGMANGSTKKHNCRVVPAVVMPKLEELELTIKVKELMENNIVSCDNLGLECLPSLQRVKVDFDCWDAFEDEVEREEAALRHAIEGHRNRPALQLVWIGKERMKRRSDHDAFVQLPDQQDEAETQ